MSGDSREKRLLADRETLESLRGESTIFDLEAAGDPPDRYTLVFRGKGISRDTSSQAKIEIVELHRCDLRLPYSYPQRAPDVRWLTPIFHPNISFSGFINLRDVGIVWDKQLSLDLLAERLWDVARMAYLNLDKTTNYAARNWFEDDENELETPVDPRPLRDKAAPAGRNVISYRHVEGERTVTLPDVIEAAPADVLYIDEETPTPQIPRRPTPRRGDRDDDDVFYIGDE